MYDSNNNNMDDIREIRKKKYEERKKTESKAPKKGNIPVQIYVII